MNRDVKTALVIGGVIVAALVGLSIIYGLVSGWQGYGYGMMDFGWGWFMPVFMVLFWGLIIWVVVVLVRGLSRQDGSESAGGRHDSALEILKERYARGEINKKEYEEKKRDLGG